MKLLKSKKTGSLIVAALVAFSYAAVAGGNGNGSEPPRKSKDGDSSFICYVLPFMCGVAETSAGNGNGSEPE
tara:strand:- start:249 stop:464 length:216 start_codon:yes stop_codon:yes gene_type:complete